MTHGVSRLAALAPCITGRMWWLRPPPQVHELLPRALCIPLLLDPFVLSIAVEAESPSREVRRDLGPDEALVVVDGAVQQVPEDLFSRPFAGSQRGGGVRVGNCEELGDKLQRLLELPDRGRAPWALSDSASTS
jgi:hypothetical protein